VHYRQEPEKKECLEKPTHGTKPCIYNVLMIIAVLAILNRLRRTIVV
jgi:hypothetical protein